MAVFPVAAPMRLLVIAVLLLCVPIAGAQTAPVNPADSNAAASPSLWRLVADGQPTRWAPSPAWTLDSLPPAARDALTWLRRRGFVHARLDSAVVDSASATLHATTGTAARLRDVRLVGVDSSRQARVRDVLGLRRGVPVTDSLATAAAARLLNDYRERGNPLANVSLGIEDDGEVLVVTLDEGDAVRLDRVEVVGGRTRGAFAARVMGVEPGAALRGYDPERLAARLRETGLYRRVDAPVLVLDEADRATLRVRLDEAPPGAFDLVLGLLPPPSGQGRAQLIGSGSLALRNLFGAGYGFAVRLDRLPGTAATASARVSSLYPRGWPLRLEGHFDGTTQDSTLTSQRYRAEGGVFVGGATTTGEGVELVGLVTLDRTRPGLAGARLVGGGAGAVQRIARTDAAFPGRGVRVIRVDDRLVPRRGLTFEATGEVGRRTRAFGRLDARADSTLGPSLAEVRVREAERQERADAHVRLYVPTFRRQSLAFGLDALLVRGATLDEGDLVRYGGATTLRGYDDDRFRVRSAVRGLAEARLHIDRESLAFLFADAAWLDQPAVPGRTALRGLYTGYGLGVTLATPAGLLTTTYAASPETGLANGRVHVGLSFGL